MQDESLETLSERVKALTRPQEPITIGGLEIRTRVETDQQSTWLDYHLRQFESMPDLDGQEAQSGWEIAIIGDDKTFHRLRHALENAPNDQVDLVTFRGSRLLVYSPEPEVAIFVQPGAGMSWYVEYAAKRVTLVYASKCQGVLKLFARTVKEVVFRSMENRGWRCYHAGAVQVKNRLYLIIGNAEAGKTTLLMALCSAGANYVSNERTYVKGHDEGKVTAVGYPQPVNVRISVGQAFPTMRPLIENYDSLRYPQSLISAEKIICFPHELTKVLDGSNPIWGGKIDGVIVPHGMDSPCQPELFHLSSTEKQDLLKGNRIKTKTSGQTRPDWLRISRQSGHEVPKALLDKPFIGWRFHISAGQILGVTDPDEWLEQAISAEI